MTSSLIMMISLTPMIMLLTFLLQQNHLLMVLLSLEGLMLSLVLTLPMLMALNNTMLISLYMIILCMGACEASLALALMVLMSRSIGSDTVKQMNLSTW